MKMKKFIPSDALKPYIKNYMIIESKTGTVNKILPDTSIVMAFRLKGEVAFHQGETQTKLPASVITGLRNSSRLINYSKNASTLLVTFKEWGAAAFFNNPLHELFGLHLSLDNLIHARKLNEVEDLLAETKDNKQRISIVERFLLSNVKEIELEPAILSAVEKIKFNKGNIRIKNLAESVSTSIDPFEKKFRRIIGTSPKQFSTIVRVRNFINRYRHSQSLTTAALEAGYFDQSHFIKDFKLFTGQTPKDFFKSPRFW